MKTIQLTKGKVAQVSNEDHVWLDQYNWHAASNRGRWYAVRTAYRDGKAIHIRMHREILQAPRLVPVVFKDGDSLNCQRENLSLTRQRRAPHRRSVSDQPTPSQEAPSQTPPLLHRLRSLLRQIHH